MILTSARATVGVLFSAFVLGACGGGQALTAGVPATAEPPPAAPPPSGEPAAPAGELDALVHDLEVSAQRIDAELVRKREEALAAADDRSAPTSEGSAERGGAAAPSKPRVSKAPAPAAAPSGPGNAAPPAPAPAPEPQATVGGPCDIMCRALASMERSATRICELTSESDERCVSARAL
ncbi:MAG TPA: hypothetical protein VGK73_36155, partial [Polyangiaceae bacterium]